ncbi:MAG: hypothetical protein COY38_04135 [Candidatus Aenigmarchaeota archaeon CG_4_10_14_0_8_um_filter_37_24]|nr:hypothetical protein [Candidatus Aenigmarchaeota archaeon]PIV68823.1 MAG: hypothetical protein COS07_02845 [Candidatus Aenigmarchaeota archaeon CG01_land_8_20_14_3_00_37_9]PIW40852.1 MAG: hypothetical protein COW21_04915 [Candidatus Aenigmarchaeota archaeon CG15_BIG_FIL_POST_REV_8_21_14_020_37_27]PIX51116.1 MAG: hypothetical protein COZ52_00460 [Candidatus Aenigmarchaeota archaeon CG_4_8_14_3_um_filter_37_24]PIY34790.1 MAG: hypothetical protein COZ04_05745 [Candidatus Aenigmarchaeota archaeo
MDIPTDLPKYVRYDFLMTILGLFIMIAMGYYLFIFEDGAKFNNPLFLSIFLIGSIIFLLYQNEMAENYNKEIEIIKLSYYNDKVTLLESFLKKDLITKKKLDEIKKQMKDELLYKIQSSNILL